MLNGSATDSLKGKSVKLPEALTFSNSDLLSHGEPRFSDGVVSDEKDNLFLFSKGIISNPANSHKSSFYNLTTSNTIKPFFDGSFEYLIQTDMSSNIGNAGASIFNSNGYVNGNINLRVKYTFPYASETSYAYGLTFATPSDTIFNFLKGYNINYNIIHEGSTPQQFNFIKNSINIKASTDPVAQDLMESNIFGDSDYFVADSDSEIELNYQQELQSYKNLAQKSQIYKLILLLRL